MAGTVGKTAVCYQGHQAAGEQILYSLSKLIWFYELRKEPQIMLMSRQKTKYPLKQCFKNHVLEIWGSYSIIRRNVGMGLLKGEQGHICDYNPNPPKCLGILFGEIFEVVEQKGQLSQS